MMIPMHIRDIRKLHRYFGLVVGIQLLFWSASGLFFSLNPIEKVRGATEAAEQTDLPSPLPDLVSPSVVMNQFLERRPGAATRSLTLETLLGAPVYRLETNEGAFLADAVTGRLLPPLDEAEAGAVAKADFLPEAPIASAELIEERVAGSEFRGAPLPLWKITFDHPLGTRIYVAANSGHVIMRRNTRWRIFDWLWMLHILDFEDRDDINNWVLRIAAALAVLTVLSGFYLGLRTSPLFRRKRK